MIRKASPRPIPLRTALLAALLTTAALAGCIDSLTGDGDGGADARFASYEAAKQAVVQSYEPVNSTSTVRLGLIAPEDPTQVTTGGTEVVVLLYDSEADEPITDAEFRIEAFMPAMGHGTETETNPTHDAHGVYIGSTNLFMGGSWVVNLDPTLADGTTLNFDIDATAQGEGGMDGGMDGGTDGDGNQSAPYGSYQEAKDAQGETFEPEQAANTSLRLKLLEPQPRTNLSTGQANLTLLLFDDATDEPVTHANFTLEAFMPAMGHGTPEETDPVHTQHGLYVGTTSFTMEGTWLLNLEASVANASYAWSLPVAVGPNATLDAGGEPPEDYNTTKEDSVNPGPGGSYGRNWTFPVNWTPAAANLTLTVSGTPLTSVTDELTLTVYDPDGAEMDAVTVSGGSSGTLSLDDLPAQGTYTAVVEGSGLEANYSLEIAVDYQAKQMAGMSM